MLANECRTWPRARGFLHHVSQLARQGQLAFAVNHAGFCAQDRAADFGPGQAGNQPDFALLVGKRVAELEHAKEIINGNGREGYGVFRAFFYNFARNLATDIADLAFQGCGRQLPGCSCESRL